jgi:hypothetical protein
MGVTTGEFISNPLGPVVLGQAFSRVAQTS